jgi:hypothetical protein
MVKVSAATAVILLLLEHGYVWQTSQSSVCDVDGGDQVDMNTGSQRDAVTLRVVTGFVFVSLLFAWFLLF